MQLMGFFIDLQTPFVLSEVEGRKLHTLNKYCANHPSTPLRVNGDCPHQTHRNDVLATALPIRATPSSRMERLQPKLSLR